MKDLNESLSWAVDLGEVATVGDTEMLHFGLALKGRPFPLATPNFYIEVDALPSKEDMESPLLQPAKGKAVATARELLRHDDVKMVFAIQEISGYMTVLVRPGDSVAIVDLQAA